MDDYTSDVVPHKTCTACKQTLPATREYFYTSGGNPPKLKSRCKRCHREDVRRYARENHEAVIQRSRQRYAQNAVKCRERCRQYRNRMKIENPERKLNYDREWRKKNRKKLRRQHREWSGQNRERVRAFGRASAARRKAQKLSAQGSHTVDDIELQKRAQTDKSGVVRCWWCGKPAGDDYEIDHRIPLAQGGSDAPENLVIACKPCNRSKASKLPHEWNGRLL